MAPENRWQVPEVAWVIAWGIQCMVTAWCPATQPPMLTDWGIQCMVPMIKRMAMLLLKEVIQARTPGLILGVILGVILEAAPTCTVAEASTEMTLVASCISLRQRRWIRRRTSMVAAAHSADRWGRSLSVVEASTAVRQHHSFEATT